MDIKPFVYESNFWADSASGWIAAIIFAALFVGGVFCVKKFKADAAYFVVIVSFVGVIMSSVIAVCLPSSAADIAYKAYVSETQKTLEADGFSIVSGSPQLKPNAQSSLLMEYQTTNFDCTLFSPKDVNKNVVFSCGEAKLTLDQIKESK